MPTHTHDGHDHGHEHGHDHHHNDVALDGLLLDIGGDVGAAIVLVADAVVGEELEMQPVGRSEARFHTGLHRRPVAGRDEWTALFPEVVEGRYEVLDRSGQPMAAVAVTGGEVVTVDLR